MPDAQKSNNNNKNASFIHSTIENPHEIDMRMQIWILTHIKFRYSRAIFPWQSAWMQHVHKACGIVAIFRDLYSMYGCASASRQNNGETNNEKKKQIIESNCIERNAESTMINECIPIVCAYGQRFRFMFSSRFDFCLMKINFYSFCSFLSGCLSFH